MRRRVQLRSLTMVVFILAASLFPIAPSSAATTWVVDGDNPACNDFGPGNGAQPLCTLLRATIRVQPGDVVQVHPATYKEQVHPPSGTAAAPIRFQATGPGVRIVGSNDVSNSTQWTQFDGDVWRRDYVNPSGQPQMMFADDTLLTKGATPATLAANEWFWDNTAKVLYANVGGGNPGAGQTIEVGALSFGFQLAGKTHVIIDGFEFSRQNFHAVNIGPSSSGAPAGVLEVRNMFVEETGSYGINVDDANSGDIGIIENEVTKAGSHGIRLRNASNVQVLRNTSHENLNSGFAVHAASDNRFIGNVAFGNANPRFRVANGFDVNFAVIGGADVGSSDNLFRNNLLFGNQDSGIQVYNGSHDNLVVRNISYGNGDHGFDTLESTGTRYISNTSFGNFLDGISVEGLSTDTSVYNNISVNNGIGREGFDLYVDDDGSIDGFDSDYNLFWKSAPETVIKVDDVEYASTAAYAADTDFETHGLGGNPRFANPAAGDFHLLGGSPAIDSAHAGLAGFQLPDFQGLAPKDDGTVANTGAGTPPYADRGALEFDPPDLTPPDTNITAGPADASSTNVNSASFQFASSETPSTFECKLDTGAWEICTSPRNYTGLSDGSHTFSVRAIDAANNTDLTPASRTWTVDTVAPDTTITAGPADGSTTNINSPSFDLNSSEPGSTLECKLDAGAWQPCTSPKNYTGLTNGEHTFSVRATDAVGNLDPSPASRTWTIDAVAPNSLITAGPANGSSTRSRGADFEFSSNKVDSTFECRLDGGAWEACDTPLDHAGLRNGRHTFSVRATDTVGNTDPTPARRTWTVDFRAPNTRFVSKPSARVKSKTAWFKFKSSESNSTFQCKRDGRKWNKCGSPKVYRNLRRGGHTLKVRAIDRLGNVDRTPAFDFWRILPKS
jgi:parallel beta-helix repeat protein